MCKYINAFSLAILTAFCSTPVHAQTLPPAQQVSPSYPNSNARVSQKISDKGPTQPRAIAPQNYPASPARQPSPQNVMNTRTPVPTPFFNDGEVSRASYQEEVGADEVQPLTLPAGQENLLMNPGALDGQQMVGSLQAKFNMETLEYRLGEFITLRGEESLGKITRVVASRDGFVSVISPISKPDGTLLRPADTVRLITRKLGTVDVTLLGERGSKDFRIVITPSIDLIEGLLMRQFPASSITLTAVGEHVLMLDGFVETASHAEGMLTLLQDFVGPKGRIINALQVSGVTQVQLEAIIARVDRSGLRRLGMDSFFATQDGFGGLPLSGKTSLSVASGAQGNVLGNLTGSDGLNTGTAFLGVTDNAKQFLFRIEALQQRGVAKILARPSLVTLSGRPAEFLVGGEQPFPNATNSLTSGVAFKKFGTRLNVLPVIIGPDKIRLDLVPEVSSVNSNQAIVVGGINVPQFQIQRVHTTVEMAPNETLVIGGLLQTVSESTVRKVPVLGSLPLVGGAFRNVSHNEAEQELVILVTPRLVHPTGPGKFPCNLPGLESKSPTDGELFLHGVPEVSAQNNQR